MYNITDQHYMTDKPVIQRVVVGAVVFNKEGKLLIVQRNKDEDIYPEMWELPSGKREFLETSNDALVREVKEEVGIDIKVIQPFSVFEYQIEKPDQLRDSTQINFIVTADSTDVKLSEEHQAFAWISKDEISKYGVSDSTKEVILKAFETYSKLS